MKNIIFVAPPAAGKGTQSKLLSEKYKIPHISTGDLLRNEINLKTDLGNILADKMQEGTLISDDIVLQLLNKRLDNNDTKEGFILDGFPRNLYQAKALDELLYKSNKKIDYVLVLDLDIEIAKKRILGRMSCPNCGAVYNSLIEESKPKVDGFCDFDSTKLSRRTDDNEETFSIRYKTYLNETAPLIDYYIKKGLVHRIDSGISKEYTYKKIVAILEKGSDN